MACRGRRWTHCLAALAGCVDPAPPGHRRRCPAPVASLVALLVATACCASAPPDATVPDATVPDIAFLADEPDSADAAADAPIMLDAPADLPPDVAPDAPSCLRAMRTDLVAYLARAPYASRAGPRHMTLHPATSIPWQAARRAAQAWAAGDCAAFTDAARAMGYDALEVTDTVAGLRHWVLIEAAGASYNGVFAFVAPADRARARPLVIDSPHLGYDFTDTRAAQTYRDTAAVAFLQNTAHRCNSNVCSGCSAISNYACGGCVVESDVVHSTGQLFYAVYDGLEAARDDLHLEYHGAAASNSPPTCGATVHLSQASSRDLTPAADDGTYPNRLWRAFERSLGATCVCYHQREPGCALNGAGSTAGRRTNQEAGGAAADVCTRSPSGLAGRFAHFEAYNVPVARVIDALREAVPLPP